MSVVVLFSGGADSATLLTSLRDFKPLALSFDYDQSHLIELDYASRFAIRLGVEHRMMTLPTFSGSALTGDKPMPEGHYTDPSMRATVVPNRNMVMLSIAASVAISRGWSEIAYAAHKDDRGTYPDCRPEFIEAMRTALAVCHYTPVTLLTPFSDMTKRQIVARGRALGVDYSQTWSCYAGGAEPCGKCGACSARSEACS
jgi:7-cyano-7-deazaguanine synthase